MNWMSRKCFGRPEDHETPSFWACPKRHWGGLYLKTHHDLWPGNIHSSQSFRYQLSSLLKDSIIISLRAKFFWWRVFNFQLLSQIFAHPLSLLLLADRKFFWSVFKRKLDVFENFLKFCKFCSAKKLSTTCLFQLTAIRGPVGRSWHSTERRLCGIEASIWLWLL